MLYGKDTQSSWNLYIAWPFQPQLRIVIFSPAFLGRILSERKGDRRHLEREIRNFGLLVVFQSYLLNLSLNFPANYDAQMRTPPIIH